MVIVVLICVAVKMFSIKDQLTLLDAIFDVVIVFVNVIVLALIVVARHPIFSCGQ